MLFLIVSKKKGKKEKRAFSGDEETGEGFEVEVGINVRSSYHFSSGIIFCGFNFLPF